MTIIIYHDNYTTKTTCPDKIAIPGQIYNNKELDILHDHNKVTCPDKCMEVHSRLVFRSETAHLVWKTLTPGVHMACTHVRTCVRPGRDVFKKCFYVPK
jgi:hypothetical protein